MEKKIENADSQMSDVELDIDFGDETDVEAIKAKAKEVLAERVGKVNENNKQLYIRTKKAEELAKSYKPQDKTEKPQESNQPSGISQKDFLFLAKANIHEDDLDKVIKFAKDENLNVQDALKNDELKAILDLRTEKRKTLEATNTGAQRRTTTKVTGDELEKELVVKGNVPTKGTKEAEDLFWSRRKKR